MCPLLCWWSLQILPSLHQAWGMYRRSRKPYGIPSCSSKRCWLFNGALSLGQLKCAWTALRLNFFNQICREHCLILNANVPSRQKSKYSTSCVRWERNFSPKFLYSRPWESKLYFKTTQLERAFYNCSLFSFLYIALKWMISSVVRDYVIFSNYYGDYGIFLCCSILILHLSFIAEWALFACSSASTFWLLFCRVSACHIDSAIGWISFLASNHSELLSVSKSFGFSFQKLILLVRAKNVFFFLVPTADLRFEYLEPRTAPRNCFDGGTSRRSAHEDDNSVNRYVSASVNFCTSIMRSIWTVAKKNEATN